MISELALVAIKEVDTHTYFKDQPGPITKKLQKAFLDLKYEG